MNNFVRTLLIASLLSLTGCAGLDYPDPGEWFGGEWFNTKKKLPGERKALFPEGVPGVSKGVPSDLVRGNQAPETETTPAIQQAAVPADEPKAKAKPKAKPKPAPKTAAAPSQPAAVPAQPAPAAQRSSAPPWPEPSGQRQQPPAAQWPDPPASAGQRPPPAAAPGAGPVQWPDPPPPPR